ncbi:hypothetical protein [Paenibacillus physcomitrellae]|uniref:hypothetical protein n=1 Tax=Paenibacillus physcomitrellae TaxID=1619311 RepID=UPI0012FDF9D0|nr:hypothetical protein [Paenibacillus physcomitrellae]
MFGFKMVSPFKVIGCTYIAPPLHLHTEYLFKKAVILLFREIVVVIDGGENYSKRHSGTTRRRGREKCCPFTKGLRHTANRLEKNVREATNAGGCVLCERTGSICLQSVIWDVGKQTIQHIEREIEKLQTTVLFDKEPILKALMSFDETV